jgi:predicted permease
VTLRVMVAKCVGVFRRRRADADLSLDIDAHLEALAEEHMRKGMPPDGARAAARRDFGGVEQMKEAYRDQRGLPFVHAIGRDVTYALRQLRSKPAFAAIAVGSIALGIAATSVAFAFLDALVLNPIPYPGADRMFTMMAQTEKGEGRGGISLNGREFAEFQKLGVLDDAIAMAAWDMTMTGGDLPVHVVAGQFSGNVFEYHGVRMARGRPFTMAEAPPDREPPPVVVLSHRFWLRQFGGDDGALGRTIRLDGEPFTVIGVAPPRFRGGADVYMPLRRPLDPKNYYGVQGRVREGLSMANDPPDAQRLVAPAVETVLQLFLERLMRENPGRFPPDVRRVRLASAVAARAARFRTTFTLLIVAAAGLLALGCANVSILLLARAANRRHEMAVRAAIGASRRRLIGQLLVESLVLAVIGGALGVLLAWRGVSAILAWLPRDFLPDDAAIGLSGVVLMVTTAIAVLTGLLFGLVPALHASKPGLRQSMQPGLVAATSPGGKRVHHMLIASQVAVSVLLLAGAGTALTTYRTLAGTTLNFEHDRVLVATLPLLEGSYRDWTARAGFFDRVRERVSMVPGVEDAALSFGFVCCAGPAVPPLQPMLLAGRETGGIQPVTVLRASPNLFSTLAIKARAGRIWTEAEQRRAARVAVVAQHGASRLWPGQNPIGQRVRMPQLKARQSWQVSAPGSDEWLDVIGVVADIPTTGLGQPSRWPVVYVPFTLNMDDIAKVVVRVRGEPLALVGALRSQIQKIDPNQPLSTTETADDVLRSTGWGREQVIAAVLVVIAAVGLLLASIGLYSVISYIGAQRAREFGIRRALGAPTADLVWGTVKPAVAAVVVGAASGVLLSVTIDRVTTQLAQLKARDPMVLAAVVGVLLVVGAAASLIPAWRTSRVSPLAALRSE